MKIIVQALVLLFLFQSCSKKNINTDLIGNWSSINSGNVVDIEIHKGSMLVTNFGRETLFSWTSDSSKVYYTQLSNIDPTLETDFIFKYELHPQKDTLYINNFSDPRTIKFLRVENAYQKFTKNIELEINLPIKEHGLVSSENKIFDIAAYVGYKNGKLVVKSGNSNNLDEIKYQSRGYKPKCMLFVDKAVPKKEIDSIKNKLKEFPPFEIFQVYINNQVNYKNLEWNETIHWWGIYE